MIPLPQKLLLCVAILHVLVGLSLAQSLPTGYLIAHSHCDVGWKSTFDEYYYNNVQYILDNVVQFLAGDVAKRFVWSEVSYFAAWYRKQGQEKQKAVRTLVHNRQLEFVGGGWVQSDEAVTDYVALLNQYTLGHQFIVENFGEDYAPVSSWQIDPFGASSFHALMVKRMGQNYHVIDRTDANFINDFDWTTRPQINGSGIGKDKQQLEFNWYPSTEHFPSESIYTHIMDDGYEGLSRCYDNYVECNNATYFDWESFDEDLCPTVTDDNVEQRASDLVNATLERMSYYRSNNVLLPFGHDFAFQDADVQFINMDKIIDYINANPAKYGIRVQYGTLSEFFNNALETTLPDGTASTIDLPDATNIPDFLPIATCWGRDIQDYNGECTSYWSGFFTSYPALKRASRSNTEFLQVAEQIYTTGRCIHEDLNIERGKAGQEKLPWDDFYDDIVSLRNASGILQHHDAITGTAADHVRADYFDLLESGRARASGAVGTILAALWSGANVLPAFTVLDGSVIPLVPTGSVLPIVLWNSLGWQRDEVIELYIQQNNLRIVDRRGLPLQSQIVHLPSSWSPIDPEEVGSTPFRLFFQASLPPMGYITLYIQAMDEPPAELSLCEQVKGNTTTIGNIHMVLSFAWEEESGMYITQSLKSDCAIGTSNEMCEVVKTDVKQHYYYYMSDGDGPYILRMNTSAHLVVADGNFYACSAKGSLVEVLYQSVNSHFAQRFLIPRAVETKGVSQSAGMVHQTHIVRATEGQEIISRFDSQLSSDGLITDSNGMWGVRRAPTTQPKWVDKSLDAPGASDAVIQAQNYYPAVYYSALEGIAGNYLHSLYALFDRPCGVSSPYQGGLEIMLQRNTPTDDGRGINTPVNDTDLLSINWRWGVLSAPLSPPPPPSSTRSKPIFSMQELQLRLASEKVLFNNPVLISYVSPNDETPSYEDTVTDIEGKYRTTFSLLGEPLPSSLHLLTFSMADTNLKTVVFRLQNLIEDPSSPGVELSLSEIFIDYRLKGVTEKSLTLLKTLGNVGLKRRGYTVVVNSMDIKTLTINSFETYNDDEGLAFVLFVSIFSLSLLFFGFVVIILVRFRRHRRRRYKISNVSISSGKNETASEREPLIG